MKHVSSPCVALVYAAFTLMTQLSAQADTFGTSGNEFTIDFVNIGNTGNAADTTGYGAVPYEYRASTYEITQNAITKATASGLVNVTAGAWTGNQPAANINWYDAAAFVNWLNTSTGMTPAYDLAWDGSAWSMTLWSSGDGLAAAAERPPTGCVGIEPFQSGGGITVSSGNQVLFGRDLAEATWHRYHGLRQVSYLLKVRHKLTLAGRFLHRMASAYVLPNTNPYPLNWLDCPQPIQAPAYIAAAIRCYCTMYPQLNLYPPDIPIPA